MNAAMNTRSIGFSLTFPCENAQRTYCDAQLHQIGASHRQRRACIGNGDSGIVGNHRSETLARGLRRNRVGGKRDRASRSECSSSPLVERFCEVGRAAFHIVHFIGICARAREIHRDPEIPSAVKTGARTNVCPRSMGGCLGQEDDIYH